MHPPPNKLYSAFSFIGFVLSVIPFYWHFKARNTGTCLYMFWTGLGCLIQCINSIIWNKNMIDRARVYCDIAIHIQAGLNVAIPACSLCINRQLYRVARMKSMGTTDSENRRILLIDLLIGVGIPVLQMITQYVVSIHRYVLLEDFGPVYANGRMLATFFLFHTWPLAIGIVSLFYCVVNIYTFYKRGRQCRQMMASTSGFSQSRYLRLIAISTADVLGTIPLATFFVVLEAKLGIVPWKSWADTHGHYSIFQVPGFVWRNISVVAVSFEIYRWSLVGSAFIFFALFGFAVEAREQYYRLYVLLARLSRHITGSTSSPTPLRAPYVTPSVPYVKRNGGVTDSGPIRVMVQTSRDKDNLSLSLTLADEPSDMSISIKSIHNSDSTAVQDSHSGTASFYTAKSFDEPGMPDGCRSSPPAAGILLTAPAPSVPPHLSDASGLTMPVHASSSLETV